MSRVEGATQDTTILCDRFWPDTHGGLERKMWNMSRALAGSGVRVCVMTENRCGDAPHEVLEPNLDVYRFSSPHYGPFWRCASFVRLWWWYRIVRSRVGRGTIWVNDPRVALAVMLAGRRGDLVYQPIGCQAARNQLAKARPGVYTMRTTAMMRCFDRAAYRYAPVVIHESQNVLGQYRDCYGDRRNMFCVHNGVEPAPLDSLHPTAARQRWGLESHHYVVGFVGRLDPTKDLGFLFEAVAASGDQTLRLLLVGEGPDQPWLEQLAGKLGLTDRIVWAGCHDDPTQAFAAMDVMVLPSVYEAFGNVLLEAMAVGVPVIGRRRDTDPHRPVLTACEELIQDGVTGFLADPHDPLDLARLLRILRLFPGARRAMGRSARQRASDQPWQTAIRQYQRIIDQSIRRRLTQAA